MTVCNYSCNCGKPNGKHAATCPEKMKEPMFTMPANDEPREGKPIDAEQIPVKRPELPPCEGWVSCYLNDEGEWEFSGVWRTQAQAEGVVCKKKTVRLFRLRDSAGGEGKVEGDRPADWYRCRVYKGDSRHKEYLEARFPKDGPHTAPFVFEGHRWQYEMTSWDDMGEYDLLVRPPDYLDHSRQPARGEMRENRHEGKAAANDLAERDELRQESARPVHDGGSGQSKPTLARNDAPLPTLAQGFLNVETREVILGASGPYSPQWVEFVAVPLDAWHAASHKHLDALLSPRRDGWNEAIEAAAKLVDGLAGKLLEPAYVARLIREISRPAAKEPLRVPIDPVYPKNSVEERAYYVACIRRDLKLANVTDWNLTRLLDLHEVETAFLRAQNRELSKGTEALVLEMSNWKNRYDQACIEIERMKKAK